MFLNDIDRNIQSSTKGLLLLQSSLYADEPDRARGRLKFSFHTKKLPKTAARLMRGRSLTSELMRL